MVEKLIVLESQAIAEGKREQVSFREWHDRMMRAVTFAEAGEPEVAKEILGLKPSLASRVYGDIVYWGTVAAAVIVMVGMVFTFTAKANYLEPTYLLSAIWQSKTVPEIWQGCVGALPQGHWYLSHLKTGNGLTESGIALGVFAVIPATLASAWYLFKQRNIFFGTLGVVAAVIIISSMVGLISVPTG